MQQAADCQWGCFLCAQSLTEQHMPQVRSSQQCEHHNVQAFLMSTCAIAPASHRGRSCSPQNACVLAVASADSLEGGQPVDVSVISVKAESSKRSPPAGPNAAGFFQVAVFVWPLWCSVSVLSKPLLCTAVGCMLHLQTHVSFSYLC